MPVIPCVFLVMFSCFFPLHLEYEEQIGEQVQLTFIYHYFSWLRIDTKDKKCSLPQKMTLDQKKAPSPYSAFYASKNRRIQQNQLSLFTALFLLLKLHQHSPVYNLILFHCPRGARQCPSSRHFLVYL